MKAILVIVIFILLNINNIVAQDSVVTNLDSLKVETTQNVSDSVANSVIYEFIYKEYLSAAEKEAIMRSNSADNINQFEKVVAVREYLSRVIYFLQNKKNK